MFFPPKIHIVRCVSVFSLHRAAQSPSQPHSSHPSLLPYLEKEYIRSQNVRSCDQMFPFDAKHITIRLFCQANFRPFKYIRHFREFCRTSFVQNSKHMFAYARERDAQGNQQSSTGVFFRRKGLANSDIMTYNKKKANDKGGISP